MLPILKPDTGNVKGLCSWDLREGAHCLLHSGELRQDSEHVSRPAARNVVLHLNVVLDELNVALVQEFNQLRLEISLVELSDVHLFLIFGLLSYCKLPKRSQNCTLEAKVVEFPGTVSCIRLLLLVHQELPNLHQSLPLKTDSPQLVCQRAHVNLLEAIENESLPGFQRLELEALLVCRLCFVVQVGRAYRMPGKCVESPICLGENSLLMDVGCCLHLHSAHLALEHLGPPCFEDATLLRVMQAPICVQKLTIVFSRGVHASAPLAKVSSTNVGPEKGAGEQFRLEMALMPLIVLFEAIKGDELKYFLVLLDCHLLQATLRSDLARVLS